MFASALLALFLSIPTLAPADAGAPTKALAPPAVELELLGATGALSEELVEFLTQRRGIFRRCSSALPADASSATFTAPLTVLPDGRAQLGRATGLSEPLWNCLAAAIRSTRFPATGPGGHNGVVTFRVRVPQAETISGAELEAATDAARALTAESECLRAAARRLEQLATQGPKVPARDRAAWRQQMAEARLAPECRLPLPSAPSGPGTGAHPKPDRCPGCKLDER